MRFLPTIDDEGATANLYYYLVTPDPTRPDLARNVRFSTQRVNVIPSVGDVIEGDFGYRSRKARVQSVEPIFPGARSFDVKLAEIAEPATDNRPGGWSVESSDEHGPTFSADAEDQS